MDGGPVSLENYSLFDCQTWGCMVMRVKRVRKRGCGNGSWEAACLTAKLFYWTVDDGRLRFWLYGDLYLLRTFLKPTFHMLK